MNQSRRIGVLLLCAGAAAGALAPPARGGPTEVLWANPVSGDWNDPLNWNPMVVPNNNGGTFNARILDPGAYTVTLDLDVTVDNLSLTGAGATLFLDTFTFTTLFGYTQQGTTLDGGGTAGDFTIGGDAVLMDVMIAGVPHFVSMGSLTFDSSGFGDDINDTCIDHGGSALIWRGMGDIRLNGSSGLINGAGSVFTIENDRMLLWDNNGAQPMVENLGTLAKDGGVGTTAFLGVALLNTGTLSVRTGTFQTDGVDVNGKANTLTGGVWEVMDNATLDLLGQSIFINAADVRLSGPNSAFAALDPLEQIDAAGALTLSTGRQFTTQNLFLNDGMLRVETGSGFTSTLDFSNSGTTAVEGSTFAAMAAFTNDNMFTADLGSTATVAGDATNNGRLVVGDSSLFEVAMGSSLTNFSAGVLTGGEFEIRGTLRFDNPGIDTIDTVLLLDGPASSVETSSGADALANTSLIADEGDLEIINGRDFTTGGSFTVAPEGRLAVGLGSTFEVPDQPGNMLTNFVNGEFTDGDFDIQGTLLAPNATVENLRNRVTLDGPDSMILNNSGGMNSDAFADLSLIDETGILTLKNGRDLDVIGDLEIRGQLIIVPPGERSGERGADETVFTVAGDLNQTRGLLDLASGRVEIAQDFTITRGTLRLSGGELMVGGLLTVAELGRLRGFGAVEGDVLNAGRIEPGLAAGALTVQGDYSQTAESRILIEIGGLLPGDEHDVLIIGGAAHLAGMPDETLGRLRVSLINGFVPLEGDFFDVVIASNGMLIGDFDSYAGLHVSELIRLDPQHLGDRVRLVAVVIPTPGTAFAGAIALLLAAPRRRR